VGGGLIGIELAEMLRSIPVTFSTRKSFGMEFYLGESQMINRHILEHHIDLRLETNLVEIISDEKDMPAVVTDKGETIDCEIVGLTAGVSNVNFLKDSGIELEKESK
jgi:NADPH-dependent 2,4-dienoyl-CoA reductase/sulfur reductase-like enzyme